ncbi:MAG: DUF2330 domain-containing protein [Deltaproteobacteria bacterium]|nr:DUF2330 domain-containing protein [Deltaproteobacteria bacterium]
MRGLLTIAALLALPSSAHAFCGFYVGGADSNLYNDATMVVMMRDGTKTVLSMQNDYQGPPEGFALVVPVPEVLGEENVRTLPKSIFERVDQLAAPRLVEYWEQDPCYQPRVRRSGGPVPNRVPSSAAPPREVDESTGVTVEAEFAVGEYDIVILSAEESSGLETWLHQNDYNMPDGAGQALEPYVQLGTKFFVAKVDPQRVTFERGRALLSPLRVHYDAETFALPIRLGLLNARGPQDLLVHILAKNARYEVANYPNVFIPTNLIVKNQTKRRFGDFYRGLFDEVSAQNEGAVVTEYSWQSNNCDPCPTQPLQPGEIALLGGDVIDGIPVREPNGRQQPLRRPGLGGSGGWTLTRLHHRYDSDDLSHDLVFRQAESVVGGRGMPNQQGEMRGQHAEVRQSSVNQFQGRYVMLHRWTGAVRCDNPVRGRWGGPPGQGGWMPRRMSPAASAPSPIRNPRPRRARPVDPRTYVSRADHQYLGIEATPAADSELDYAADPPQPEAAPEPEEPAEPEAAEPEPEPAEPEPQPQPNAVPVTEDGGCASCATSGRGAAGALLFLVALGMVLRRRS